MLLFFLAVQGQTGPDYSFRALSVTWRMQYALGLLPIMYMLAYRIFYLKESAIWQVLLQAECEPMRCLTPFICFYCVCWPTVSYACQVLKGSQVRTRLQSRRRRTKLLKEVHSSGEGHACLPRAPLSRPPQEQRRKEKEGRLDGPAAGRRERRRRLWLFIKNYWHRLVGAAVGWFAWDFYYCEHNPNGICPAPYAMCMAK